MQTKKAPHPINSTEPVATTQTAELLSTMRPIAKHSLRDLARCCIPATRGLCGMSRNRRANF
jgi:hypothetical protein